MEATVSAPEIQAPAPAPAPAVAPAPAPVSTPTFEEGGATDSITRGKMNIKDIILSVVVIVMGIYTIISARKAIKKLDEQPSVEEFDSLADMVDEHDKNLKKALGKKYQTI